MKSNTRYKSKAELKNVLSSLGDNVLKDLFKLKDVDNQAINFYLSHLGLEYSLEVKPPTFKIETEPLISILMTTWNRRNLLEKTIESIFALDYCNFQFIIVDDNSTDDTEKYVLSLMDKHPETEILFIKTSGKKGPGLNKRLGLDKVKGDYIIFIDDDDFYIDPHWIKKSLEIFKKYPKVASVWFNSLQLYMNSNELLFPVNTQMSLYGVQDSSQILEGFQTEFHKPQSTFPAIFNTQKYMAADANKMKILNDTSIYLRGLLAGDVYISDALVGVYRIHDGSIGTNVSFNFIIDNIEEKRKISKKLPPNINQEEWFYKQSRISLNYYLHKSKTISWINLFKWLNKFPYKYRRKFYFEFIKQRLVYHVQRVKNHQRIESKKCK